MRYTNAGTDPHTFAAQYGYEYVGLAAGMADFHVMRIAATDAFSPLAATIATLDTLTADASVVYFEQLYPLDIAREAAPPTDPLYADQFHLKNTGQFGGIAGNDINVEGVWAQDITGAGIDIAIVDDGLDYLNPDLDGTKFLVNRSYDYANDDNDPIPTKNNASCSVSPINDCHGTSVAGIAAAEANNGECGAGVAYNASLSGHRIFGGSVTTLELANAFLNQTATDKTKIRVYNNSWGPSGTSQESASSTIINALKTGAETNKSIYVWSAGNSHLGPANGARRAYSNSRYAIAVGASDIFGIKSIYSEDSSALFVNAPSSSGYSGETGTYTTDLVGAVGYGGVTDTDCTSGFGGTSSAAPTVAGVVALMLEANPDLTARDVQHILTQTATKNDASHSSWQTNGAGLHTSNRYGFGRVNALAAVNMAKTWVNVSAPPITETFATVTVNQAIPDGTTVIPLDGSVPVDFEPTYGAAVTSTFTVTTSTITQIEHVDVAFAATHPFAGDIRVILQSPSGTRSEITDLIRSSSVSYSNRTLTSVQFWGENPIGMWQIEVYDGAASETTSGGSITRGTGVFTSWTLRLHGTGAVTPQADLRVSLLSIDPDVTRDGTTNVDITMENIGTTAAGAFDTTVYLSTDNICDPLTDTALAEIQYSGMGANSNLPFEFVLAVPRTILLPLAQTLDPAGMPTNYVTQNVYYVCAKADSNTTVTESNEANNLNRGISLDLEDATHFPWDINSSGQVTATDAIFVINRLGQTVPPADTLADLNASGLITSTDAISVINRLTYQVNPNPTLSSKPPLLETTTITTAAPTVRVRYLIPEALPNALLTTATTTAAVAPQVWLQAVDLDGVDGLRVGEYFNLELHAAAGAERAVFSAYADVLFDAAYLSATALQASPAYELGTMSRITADGVLQVGGTAACWTPDCQTAGNTLVATVRMRVLQAGATTIRAQASPAAGAEVTVFGYDGDQRALTHYGTVSLNASEAAPAAVLPSVPLPSAPNERDSNAAPENAPIATPSIPQGER